VQAALLGGLVGADAASSAGMLLLGAGVACAIVPPLLRRWPEATAMLALGGLGMTLGWWADQGFRSAAAAAPHAPAALDTLWCRTPLAGDAWLGHLLSWMNAGMLALGLPASALARRSRRCAHDAGASVACALAMIAGMTAGSYAAARLAAPLAPPIAVLGDWLGMTLGMLAGMGLVRAAARVQMPRHAASATSAQPITVTRKPAAPA
jgi:hypothetical protein